MNNIYLEIFIEVLVFAIVVAIALAGSRAVEGFVAVRRRLADRSASSARVRSTAPIIRKTGVKNPFLEWVRSVSSLNDPKDKDNSKLRRALFMAGFEGPAAPVVYFITRISLAIGLPIAFILAQALLRKPMTGIPLIFGALALCAMGLILPRAFIDNRANSRRQSLEHEFPDALDLMVVCVEAGLGIEAAFVRVGQEIRESHPRMADAFDRVSQELRAGRSRADALRSMAERCDVEPVRSFVALLIQTDALGTSIGQTLRTYSTETRANRFLKAEEKAMRIPVLMTMPLVACILPVIIVALLLPPVIDVIRVLAPALAGK
jgi:tight adherence protein C